MKPLPSSMVVPFAVVAVVVVSAWTFGGWSDVSGRFLESGSASYGAAARGETAGRPPLYPWFLAFCRHLSGDDGMAGTAVFVQHLLLVAVCWGVWRLGGPMALFLLACNLNLLRESLIQRETGLFQALVLAEAALVASVETERMAFAAGLVAGLACLTRPTGILVVVAMVVVLLRSADGRRRLVLVAVLASLIPPLVTAGLQMARGIELCVTGTAHELNVFKGTNDVAAVAYPWLDLDGLDDHPCREAAARRGYVVAVMDFWMRRPGAALRLTATKFVVFFAPTFVPLARGTLSGPPEGPWRIDVASWRWKAALAGLAPLPGLVAFFVAFRRQELSLRGRFTVLLVGLAAVVHTATFAETRFRLPFDPLLALLAVELSTANQRVAPQ